MPYCLRLQWASVCTCSHQVMNVVRIRIMSRVGSRTSSNSFQRRCIFASPAVRSLQTRKCSPNPSNDRLDEYVLRSQFSFRCNLLPTVAPDRFTLCRGNHPGFTLKVSEADVNRKERSMKSKMFPTIVVLRRRRSLESESRLCDVAPGLVAPHEAQSKATLSPPESRSSPKHIL